MTDEIRTIMLTQETVSTVGKYLATLTAPASSSKLRLIGNVLKLTSDFSVHHDERTGALHIFAGRSEVVLSSHAYVLFRRGPHE